MEQTRTGEVAPRGAPGRGDVLLSKNCSTKNPSRYVSKGGVGRLRNISHLYDRMPPPGPGTWASLVPQPEVGQVASVELSKASVPRLEVVRESWAFDSSALLAINLGPAHCVLIDERLGPEPQPVDLVFNALMDLRHAHRAQLAVTAAREVFSSEALALAS